MYQFIRPWNVEKSCFVLAGAWLLWGAVQISGRPPVDEVAGEAALHGTPESTFAPVVPEISGDRQELKFYLYGWRENPFHYHSMEGVWASDTRRVRPDEFDRLDKIKDFRAKKREDEKNQAPRPPLRGGGKDKGERREPIFTDPAPLPYYYGSLWGKNRTLALMKKDADGTHGLLRKGDRLPGQKGKVLQVGRNGVMISTAKGVRQLRLDAAP